MTDSSLTSEAKKRRHVYGNNGGKTWHLIQKDSSDLIELDKWKTVAMFEFDNPKDTFEGPMVGGELTSEAKLKAIIEAQKKGGHGEWEHQIENLEQDEIYLNGFVRCVQYKEEFTPVLMILLDTKGAKAAYGEYGKIGRSEYTGKGNPPFWQKVSTLILDAWHSDSRNNWKAAIDVAYSLLPTDD